MTVRTLSRRLGVDLAGSVWVSVGVAMVAAFAVAFFVALSSLSNLLY